MREEIDLGTLLVNFGDSVLEGVRESLGSDHQVIACDVIACDLAGWSGAAPFDSWSSLNALHLRAWRARFRVTLSDISIAKSRGAFDPELSLLCDRVF